MSMINEFAEKLISRLEEKQDEYFHGTSDYEEGKYNAYDEVAQIVNQLAEEYKDVPDTNVGKWILCSERLPEELGRYIVTLKDGRSLEAIYDNISKRFIMYEHDVIAWQPLPEPYKGE